MKLVLAGIGGLLFLWLLDVLIVTDAEEVEDNTARIIELANDGSPETVDAMMEWMAEDFDAGGLSREQIRGYLKRVYDTDPPNMVRSGGITAVWKKDRERFRVQLRVTVVRRGSAQSFLVTIFWAERDDEWKIVRVVRGWPR